MTTADPVTIIRRICEAYNAHQSDAHWLDAATEAVDQDCEIVDAPSGMISHGVEGMRQFLLGWVTAFPDAQLEITNLVGGPEWAVLEFIARGTHLGPLQGPTGTLAPTGRKAQHHFCQVFQFKNGKMVRHITYYDVLSMVQKLSAETSQPVTEPLGQRQTQGLEHQVGGTASPMQEA